MNKQLLALCKTTVHYKTKTGLANAYGDPSLSTQAELLAYVTSKRGVTNTSQGQPPRVSTVLYTETALVQGDLVWLPENDETEDSAAQTVREVFIMRDEKGAVDHYEVHL